MDLSQYAEALRRELTAITRFAGEDITRAAEMLTETLDASVRLALLDVLSAAADEITASLDGATIDVRLTGTEPEFVVSSARRAAADYSDAADYGDEGGSARITLRVSDALKGRVEAAAAAAGTSVNSWLVRAISRAFEPAAGGPGPRNFPPIPPVPPVPQASGRRGPGKRYTGFARS
jgi:hypothetical protein